MKINNIILMFLIPIMAACQNKNISLGSKLDTKVMDSLKIVIPSGAFAKASEIIVDEVKYLVGTEDGIIIYISTSDKSFSPVAGISIGNLLKDIGADTKDLGYIPGWGYYTKIDSNWYAGFDFKETPRADMPIKWFFKYNFGEKGKKLFSD